MSLPPPEYIAARKTLLNALDALRAHRDSLILIGAQAVYFHTRDVELGEPPMTTDADLAINVTVLADDPEISETMRSAGFKVGQPGNWLDDSNVGVDLMVAPHQAGTTKANARAAKLPPHDKMVGRIGHGLAPALVDNAPHIIAALDPNDDRIHEIRVAGPAALLVAKTIKISDRIKEAAEGKKDRIVDKDALDILRLLQAPDTPNDLIAALKQHPSDSHARADVELALDILGDLATAEDGEIPRLAARAARDNPAVSASMAYLVTELLDAYQAND